MKIPAHLPASGLPIETVSVNTARKTWGALLDRVARGTAVTITRNGQPVAVMLPPDFHEPPSADQADLLAILRAEFDARFARMQTPEARAGIDALFKAGPKELGLAAVKAAKRGR